MPLKLPPGVDAATWRLVFRGVSLREIREEWTLEDLDDALAYLDAEQEAQLRG